MYPMLWTNLRTPKKHKVGPTFLAVFSGRTLLVSFHGGLGEGSDVTVIPGRTDGARGGFTVRVLSWRVKPVKTQETLG